MNRIALTILIIVLTSVFSYAQETTTATAPASAPSTEEATAASQDAATEPATAPAATGPDSQPATTQAATSQATTTTAPADDAVVAKILADLEAAGKAHRTIQADLVYKVSSAMGGGADVRTGYVMFQKETPALPARFRIHFDTLKQGKGAKVKELQDYAFYGDAETGQWLAIAEHANKKLRRIQVAAPGQRVEPLRIGKGPFPLPFGQKADEVLKYFNVTTRPLMSDEPAGTTYVKLVPKRQYRKDMNFAQTEMWVDPKINLPIQIASKEKNKDRSLVVFSNIKINLDIQPQNFILERPSGWALEVPEPLKK